MRLTSSFDQQLVLLISKRFVRLRTSRLSKYSASPPLAYAQFAADTGYGVTVLAGRQNFPFNASLSKDVVVQVLFS